MAADARDRLRTRPEISRAVIRDFPTSDDPYLNSNEFHHTMFQLVRRGPYGGRKDYDAWIEAICSLIDGSDAPDKDGLKMRVRAGFSKRVVSAMVHFGYLDPETIASVITLVSGTGKD